MRCVNPEVGRLLLLYALRKLPPSLEEQVRIHLKECDSCVEDLMTLHRAGSFFSRYVDEHPDEVDRAAGVLKRRRLVLAVVSAVVFLTVATSAFLVGRHLSATAPDADSERLRASVSPRTFRIAAAGEMARLRSQRAEMLLRWAADWLKDPTRPELDDLLELAGIETSLGRHQEALATLSRAAEMTEEAGEPERTTRVLVQKAHVFLLGALERDRAEAVIRQAEAAAEVAGTALARAWVHQIELLEALVADQDLETAGEIARRILSLSDGHPEDARLRGIAREANGLVLEATFVAGSRDEETLGLARDHFSAAAGCWELLGDGEGLARARLALGRIALLSDRPADADPPLREAAMAFQASGDLRGLALARANLASAELLRGNPAEALAALEPTLAEAERSGDPFLRFDALALKGRILIRLDRLGESREALRTALDEGRRIYLTPRRSEDLALVERLIAAPDAGDAGARGRVVASGIY